MLRGKRYTPSEEEKELAIKYLNDEISLGEITKIINKTHRGTPAYHILLAIKELYKNNIIK
jgi:hypothetical protein